MPADEIRPWFAENQWKAQGMSNTQSEQTLREQIAAEKEHLARLEEQREQALARMRLLRERLDGLGSGTSAAPPSASTIASSQDWTSAEKLELFAQRFRGRPDVFAKRWTNRRSGRSGYAPACRNEWIRGVCEKPRVRCGECPNQAFVPVTDQVLLSHLLGRHVAGVYPLLPDDTCWFLAADFDGDAWRDDVRALVETCRKLDLTPAIERSRSGRGAHAWFFFDEPVDAAAARNLGCLLITETMSRRHELPMSSYDRLFPSQDTLPKGGFGNLIALPFQDGPRQEGNTVFLDGDLEPHADQWAYLASTPRISSATLHNVLDDAHKRGGFLRIAAPTALDEDAAKPWTRRPSGRVREPRIAGPLPKRVEAVLAQRLFVEKAGLPSPLLSRIKRLAAFQNPEFYKKQNLRLSTALTPRIISCTEDFPVHVGLPRGCLAELRELLAEHHIELALRDERMTPEGPDFEFDGELTPVQSQAAGALLEHETGVLVAPPGSGKTVVGVYLVAQRRTNTLILVHRRPLAEQWRAQLALFFGIPEKEIGRIGGGRNKPNGRLDVAMLQSLVRKDSVRDLVADYGQVIVDECHHIPAVSFERILAEVKARYVVGLTATPTRRDGHDPIIRMQCGSVRFTVSQRHETERQPFEHELVIRETDFEADETTVQSGIQAVYGKLILDERRNRQIVDDTLSALEEGRSPLVLTERKEHLDLLASELDGFVRNLVVLRGGMSPKERRETAGRLEEIGDQEERLVLATGRYIGEGFDDPRLDTLFLTMPISWKGTLIQYVGRLHRSRTGKSEVLVYDYVDREVPMLARMFEKRLRTYRAMGYSLVAGS